MFNGTYAFSYMLFIMMFGGSLAIVDVATLHYWIRNYPIICTTVMSQWAWWRLKYPTSWLIAQSFVQAHIKESIKVRVTGLCEGSPPVDSPLKGQWLGKCFHLMTSLWEACHHSLVSACAGLWWCKQWFYGRILCESSAYILTDFTLHKYVI